MKIPDQTLMVHTLYDYQILAKFRGCEYIIQRIPETTRLAIVNAWMCDKHHHIFTKSYENFKKRQACPKCMSTFKPIEEYHILARAVNFVYISNEVPAVWSAKLKTNMWMCEYGHCWSQSYKEVQLKKECKLCKMCKELKPLREKHVEAVSQPRRFQVAQYQDIAEKPGFKYICSDVPARTDLKLDYCMWECNKGHQWSACYQAIRSGVKCPTCRTEDFISLEDYVNAAAKRNFKYLLSTIPKTGITKLDIPMWECESGHQWSATYHVINTFASGCPHCWNHIKKGLVDYQQVGLKNGIKYILERVPKNATTRFDEPMWMCKFGHTWSAIYGNIASNHGCPTCKESRGERKLRNYFTEKQISFSTQFRFDEFKNRPYDFYLSAFNLLIEYDGRQHFQDVEIFETKCADQQKIDREKTQFALDSGYKVCRISYVHFKHLEQTLDEVFTQLRDSPDVVYIEKF